MSENLPRSKTIITLLRRVAWIALAVFLLIFTCVLPAVYWVLDSEHGTQWSLQIAHRFLPELNFTDAHGAWLHGIRAAQISWRGDSVEVELDNVELRLHWPSMLHGEINLPTLHAQTLRITPKGPSSDKPIELPALFLPFALAASDFALQRLDIINTNSTFTLQQIHSALRWQGATLRLTPTQMRWDDIKLNAAGTINFRGDYSLRLSGQLELPQWPAPISVTADGDLRHLQLHASSDKPYALNAQIELATLDKNLLLQAHAQLIKPFVQTFGSDHIKIYKAALDASGDLTQIDGNIALALNDSHNGASQFNSKVHWQPQQLHADSHWTPAHGNLQLQCDANLNKPISAVCSGNAASIALTPWLNGATGEISGDIKLEAKWLDPQWMLALTLPNLSGKFNSDTIAAKLDVRTDDGTQWQLNQLSLAIGSNELKGSGQFGSRYRLQAQLNARDLSHIYPRLAGSATGTVAMEGDTSTPTLRGQFSGNKLQFDNLRAAQTYIEFTLPKLGNESGRGRIDVQQLAVGAINPFNLTLSISGSRPQQRWALNLQQEANRVALQCNTQSGANLDDWQLACSDFSGHLRSGRSINYDWRNTTPLRGSAQLAQKQFELAPFCLRSEDAELCLDQTLRYADAKLLPFSAHARGLPLRWVKPWLPDDFNLVNDARAAAQLQLKSLAPLSAQATVQIPETQWRWHTATATETAAINAIHFDAALAEQRAQFSTSAQFSIGKDAPTLGRIATQLNVNDPRNKRDLDGRIDIEQLELAGFAWLVQGLDAISGQVNGSIGIGGTAKAPQLRGQLLLKNGSATWAPLGAPFRTVNADVTFADNSAKLGGWFALGQGGGDIDGTLNWEGTGENWKLRLGLIAGGVSAMPLPNSTVVFSPHAELIAVPNEMHINGYVDIASAEIQLKQLPPETIDVSQDTEIVGQQIAQDAWKIWAELGLNLGDQFHLSGFGADVNLSGRLQLSKAPNDILHMTGDVKVPRGRYRAYGQRLTVRKGSVIFYGPLENPDLSLEAVRDMPPGVTDVVGLRVIGSLKTPEAILFSEPSMPDSDIAYYLLTGRKPIAGAAATSGYSASGALLSLGMAGSEGKAGQLAQKFGITDLQLGTSENATGNSEAEVSGQLGKDLYVRYGRGLGQRSNSISFQYRLTPKLMIETISGIDDALDLLYSFEVK